MNQLLRNAPGIFIAFRNVNQVVVKTVSGSVASWPATGNVTTQPLPVLLPERPTHVDDETKEVTVNWEPNPESHQDQYKVGYERTCEYLCLLFALT